MGWWRRNKREEELDREIRSHLLAEAEEQLSTDAARRAFGNPTLTKELVREMWGWASLERFVQDLRYGLRLMARSPGFTAVAVLSLALGIGANTAIFSVFDALLLRTLPVRNPEQLITLTRTDGRRTGDSISYPMFQSFRNLRQVFSDMSALYQTGQSNVMLNGPAGCLDDGTVVVGLVSGSYFSMLGVKPSIGRLLTSDDDRILGGHPVTVISYNYWQRRFGGARDVPGRTLTFSNTTYTILGVAAKGFSGEAIASPTDLWIPMAMESQVIPDRPGLLTNQSSMWTHVIGRMQPGMTAQQAQPLMQVTFQQLLLERAGPGATPQTLQQLAEQRIQLEPAGRGFAVQRQFFSQPLKILLIVVAVVLLIACANIANLLLARSAARQREMAVRLAIGAGRLRIVRQLLTESILLATMGGTLGLLFAKWGTKILLDLAASGRAPMHLDVHPDARILAFTAALCLLTGIVFGLAPASSAAKVSLTPALNERGAGLGNMRRGFGLGKVLVISQVALSLLLLIGAGLFVSTLRNLRSQDLGFDREHVLLIWTAPSRSNGQGAALARLYEAVQERISSLPGVASVSPSRNGLLSGFVGIRQVNVEGYAAGANEDMGVQWSLIAPKFFETIGMRLLLGRDISARDSETAPKVAIINETMARDFFRGQNPIGKRFAMGRDEGYPVEIVGVVQDSKYFSLRDKKDRMMYLPYRQDLRQLTAMCVAVRTVGELPGLVSRIRDELRNIDQSLRIQKIETTEDQVNATIVEDRLLAVISGFFGLLAVLLACLGLYGVMSYTAARRTNEIGIRLALGATRASMLGMVLKESLLLVVAGIAIGVPVALATARLISGLLFGVSATDPATISLACVLMIVVAAMAALLPARRAARVDPMVALRYE
jgi:predicted permease